jgi:hypothetical protein
VARQEAARIASIPNDDKAKVLKAAEDLRFLLRMEQKGDYESIYFWAGFDCLERKHGDDWSEVEQVTKLILREGQVAKLMDETAYILRNARELVDYKASPYDIAPSLGISDRISRDDLERHMLASAEQKIANIFKILKAAGMTEN